MATRRQFIFAGTALAAGLSTRLFARAAPATPPGEPFEITHTDEQWRAMLSPGQYRVLRQAGTEAPYSSPLNSEHRKGIFSCAGCELPLYSSATKFESHTGWPSFWAPLEHAIGTSTDYAIGVPRTEVHCRRCGGHLGHVFNDGPKPTGLRYCMNGLALEFKPSPT